MKKTTLFAVMAMLCLNFGYHAYAQIGIPALKVGDKLPPSFWEARLTFLAKDGKKRELAMQTFRGKALIIDFWGCFCGACINHFVLLNQIQEKNQGLVIVPVNTKTTRDTEEKILELTSGKKYPHIKLDMPTIIADTTIAQFFPHHAVPYYVWVSNDGRIRAITMSLLVNEANIKLLLNPEN